MSRSKKLKPIQGVFQTLENDAAQVMGQARAGVTSAEQKLDQLIQFKADYQVKFTQTMSRGLTPARIRDFQVFLNRLDNAILEQRKQISNAKEYCTDCEQAWLQRRSKTKALGTVVDRYQQRETQQENRREQKELDEFAVQSHFRNKH